MCIGLTSAGKSPAIESVLSGVRRAEKPLRQAAQAEHETWEGHVKLAKLAEQAWEAKRRKVIEKGQTAPAMPDDANIGPAPHIPRLIVNDGTVTAQDKVDVYAPGSETIDGQASYRINKVYNGIAVWSDGNNWIVIQAKST